jgi:hypothetical protein
MINEKKLQWMLALGVFAVAFGVYLATLAPTVTFWDCGELIACSHILGNPHPPGNPLFLLMARAVIVLLPFQEVAFRVNVLSSLASSLTVMMAFLFTVKMLRLLLGSEKRPAPGLLISLSSQNG